MRQVIHRINSAWRDICCLSCANWHGDFPFRWSYKVREGTLKTTTTWQWEANPWISIDYYKLQAALNYRTHIQIINWLPSIWYIHPLPHYHSYSTFIITFCNSSPRWSSSHQKNVCADAKICVEQISIVSFITIVDIILVNLHTTMQWRNIQIQLSFFPQ